MIPLANAICPTCGLKMDSLTSSTGTKDLPPVGTITICGGYGDYVVFTEDLKLDHPTIDQIMKLHPDLIRFFDEAQKVVRITRVK